MEKILHITECLGSGVLNYVKNMSAWQAEEYEVYVAYATRPETPADFKGQFDSRVHFIEVEGFTREISPVNDLKAFRSVRKIVGEIQPDYIHLHSTKAGVIGRWAINTRKYKCLYSPHAYSFLMMDAGRWKRKIYELIEKISDRRDCLTVTIIDSELKESRKVTRNAICIPSGINLSEMDLILEEAKRDIKEKETFTICMLGKLVPQKNPQLFNRIAKEFPDSQFVWVGEGPLRDVLDSSNIRITGWLTRTQAMAEVLSADVFLFATAWEGLSIALLEVMYAGKPCVVSTADGNRDVIKNGHNGFVCGELPDYVSALQTLRGDKELRERYGQQARMDVMERYNVKAMEAQYRELFARLSDKKENRWGGGITLSLYTGAVVTAAFPEGRAVA